MLVKIFRGWIWQTDLKSAQKILQETSYRIKQKKNEILLISVIVMIRLFKDINMKLALHEGGKLAFTCNSQQLSRLLVIVLDVN